MSAAAFLRELESLGVKVWPDAGVLRFRAPADAMTPELTARIRQAKPELIAILNAPPAANDAETADTEPGQDLPLLAALAEFDALIDRLCRKNRFSESVCAEMRNARRRMSPDALRAELPIIRRAAK